MSGKREWQGNRSTKIDAGTGSAVACDGILQKHQGGLTMKPTTKKIIAILAFWLIAHVVFALTETVDGVTWTYCLSNDCAVLEYPGLRNMKSSLPMSSLYDGDFDSCIIIPNELNGFPVTTIGALAFHQYPNSNIDTVVIPETITCISSISFTGAYGTFQFSGGKYSAIYCYYWYTCWNSGLTNIVFLGDCPTVLENSSWFIDPNSPYSSDRTWNEFGTSESYGVHSGGKSQFLNCNCYVVEGSSGWSIGGMYCGGTVKYGAAKVDFTSQSGNVFDGYSTVELSCPNNTANIYYTLDGSEPTTNVSERCILYTNPIELTHRATIKALAFVEGYPYTIVYSNEYAFGAVQIPIIMAVEENVFHLSGNSITLSCETEDAEIRYTLDGSEPTEKSALYTEPFTIDDTTTVKAKAFKTDWFESETAVVTFTREWYTVETPVITPGDTTFENASQEVSIGCDTEGATIYYTTDGSDPKENGREYRHPFMVYNTCTVRTIAVKYDWKDSAETTATFTRNEALSAAANLYGYNMETSDAAWIVDGAVSHDGVSSIKSNGDGSYVQTSVRGAGTLLFWWRAMCEEPEGGEYYDYGVFKVGSAEAAYIAGNDTGWVFFSTNIATTGKHKLSWEYRKDEEGTFAPDCIWLDQVQWIPADGSGYTLTTPEPVPYSWLTKYGLGLESDFESAANALSGKMQGGKETKVWEEFVAGTDPTNETSVLTAMIEMQDGVPIITWEPNLNTNGEIRLYKVYGKRMLSPAEDWAYPTNSLHRFFKVTVEMP